MKRTSSNASESIMQPTKRRRHPSTSEDDDDVGRHVSSVLHQMTEPPPMSKIYNSSFRNNKPAELFRKDLISAMKVADSEQLLPEDYWLMVDTWKQEWEKGVQVPVNPHSLPSPTCRKLNKKSSSKGKTSDFKLPKKLVRCTHDEFFSNELHLLSNVASRAETVCRYDADDVDVHWLKMINEELGNLGLCPVTESDMELMLEEFENQCANSLQEAIRKEEGLGIEFDENVICDVCRSPDSEDGNEMVFCDSCNICVHQACYGITTIPEGSWVCRTCALGIRPPCILCPNRGGAMKSTRSGQKWAHVSCALWVPEVSIGCVEKMEPITKICHIPASRWALVCSICRERSGACIQCSVKTCKTAYHVTCAFKDGLEMKAIIDEENEEDGVKLRSFCDKHSKKKDYLGPESDVHPRKIERGRRELEMSSEEKAGARAQRIRDLEDEFYNHVVTKDCCDLLKMDPFVVDFVFQYWKLKRKANWNRALLTPRAEESDLLVKQQEDSLYARMKMFVHLRQDLERVRNLCYMVNRREKLTRSYFRMREDVFRKQVALLSARGAQKLTPKEREAVLQANRGENVYDRLSMADSEEKVPLLQSVVSVLQGKDADLYSPRKTPKKTPELCRLPNPYAKQYPNGVRRSHRRFASLLNIDSNNSPWASHESRAVQLDDAQKNPEDTSSTICLGCETAVPSECEEASVLRCRRKNATQDDEWPRETDENRNSGKARVADSELSVSRPWQKKLTFDECKDKKSEEVHNTDEKSDIVEVGKAKRKTADAEKLYLGQSSERVSEDVDVKSGEDCSGNEEGRRLRSCDNRPGPLSGYRIPKRVQVEGAADRGHLPVSPLSSVAEYLAPASPRLVIKLRKDPQELWQGQDRFQVVRNDWDSQGRRSERQRKPPFAYDRYRFRSALHRTEFFS